MVDSSVHQDDHFTEYKSVSQKWGWHDTEDTHNQVKIMRITQESTRHKAC